MTTLTFPPVVFCGPSGVGKGTLIELLRKRFPDDQFGFSVSNTTRSPRDGEIDGVHYHFTTVESMKQEIAAGNFIEFAEVHGRPGSFVIVTFYLPGVIVRFGEKMLSDSVYGTPVSTFGTIAGLACLFFCGLRSGEPEPNEYGVSGTRQGAVAAG